MSELVEKEEDIVKNAVSEATIGLKEEEKKIVPKIVLKFRRRQNL